MKAGIRKEFTEPFGNLDLFAQQVVEGFITGIHKSPFHGFSVEFAEHRLYNSGESVKNIDWKVFGRTDKLFVKKFEEETNLRCQIVIDSSTSMNFSGGKASEAVMTTKISFAIHAAAVLLNILRRQRDAFGLTLFTDAIELHTEARSSSVHYTYLISELEKRLSLSQEKSLSKTSIPPLLHHIADSVHKRSLVILFTDMFDSNETLDSVLPALQHLKHNKHEVIIFHVFDKLKEIDFNYDNRPYKFVDMETGEEIKLNPGDIKNTYKNAMNNFQEELYRKCAQYRIDIIQADISKGFNQVLYPFFMKRRKFH